MSYKEKATAIRTENEAAYRGGALTVQEKPKRPRYPCFADSCPMPGTIFPGETKGTDGKIGVCAWHYGLVPTDIPKVTRVLLDWECVSFEINQARRIFCGEHSSDVKFINEAFAKAWDRLQPAAGEWAEQLKPGTHTNRAGLSFPEDYGLWVKRLERFLGARVVEVLSTHHRRSAAA